MVTRTVSTRALFMAFVLGLFAAVAQAQSGWVEGRVTDGTEPIKYANVLLRGMSVGAMTDARGAFRFRVPCGRFTLRVLAMGYAAAEAPVTVRKDATERVGVTLVPAPRVEADVIDVIDRPTQVGSAVSVSNSVDASQIQTIGAWNCPATTDTVRHGDIEFWMRYVLAGQGDSVVVNVIAEARNASDHPVAVCGCFSLWNTRYGRGPDDLSQIPLGPARTPDPGTIFTTLDVPPLECGTPRFEEAVRTLLPGETLARGLVFSFFENAFRDHPGVLEVDGVFRMGRRGDAWEDTDLVDLGTLTVPIRPIGMPIRP
ncbi:MAG TPA: carboxypeptidase regulatory-like domain-containing protein [Candidatus Krumholzibacteria bacterium]|nr:carboxypeptidase regulatory-like domain-containing protein [Candidatus Krumholzibacteria bacterium]